MSGSMVEREYQVVVVGGGISGVCAALASARHGAQTALIQDRPVLGGNASSEIRMHICGANREGSRENARETGIIEEILLENQARNPQHSFSVCDTILWEKCAFQENLHLYLNTRFLRAEAEAGRVRSIWAHQLTTEKDFRFSASLFIDATGDGMLRANHARPGRTGGIFRKFGSGATRRLHHGQFHSVHRQRHGTSGAFPRARLGIPL